MDSKDRCPECSGGGLVPALGCTCVGSAHNCPPAVCRVCMGSGVPVACPIGRSSAVNRSHPQAQLIGLDQQ
jgi:hypothetical protein